MISNAFHIVVMVVILIAATLYLIICTNGADYSGESIQGRRRSLEDDLKSFERSSGAPTRLIFSQSNLWIRYLSPLYLPQRSTRCYGLYDLNVH